jgi:hypothetical protein
MFVPAGALVLAAGGVFALLSLQPLTNKQPQTAIKRAKANFFIGCNLL